MFLDRKFVRKLFSNLSEVQEQFFTETKTMFNITKVINGHHISLTGPKTYIHQWNCKYQSSIDALRFPNRSGLTITKARLKINNGIICSISNVRINAIVNYNSSAGGIERHIVILGSEESRITDIREKNLSLFKLIFPEFFSEIDTPDW